MIEPYHAELSIARQCALVGLPRSSYYYHPCGERVENLQLMEVIDRLYTKRPFYGVPRITAHLNQSGYLVNHKRVARLMGLMGLRAIYPAPKLSANGTDHTVYPYLLRHRPITHPNHVWATDITYLRMYQGFLYLVVIMDWFSRYVLAWALSNSLEVHFCLEALDAAFLYGQPSIFNSDQGAQFTSVAFLGKLQAKGVRISMDGRGRVFDNIFVERLWRSVKYEEVYLKEYTTGLEAYQGLKEYFQFYNTERPHQSLQYRTPAEIYFEKEYEGIP